LLLCLGGLGACGPAEAPLDDLGPAPVSEETAAAEPAGAPVVTGVAATPPARPVLEQELAYGEFDNRNLQGFLAMPADVAEPQPGILVIHERWGLNENMRTVARRLAAEGYIALAVDLYGGATATTPEQAEALMRTASAEPARILGNLQQGYDYLERYALSPSIGTVGWCFGGGWALQAALQLPPGLDAAVMYYGPVVTDSELLRSLQVPLLGLFGALDTRVPVRDAQLFRNRLNELGKDADIFIYSDADQAFADPSGGNYAPAAAEDAWRRTTEFLAARLRSGLQ
jgi:carboxymethylenebutenolidase